MEQLPPRSSSSLESPQRRVQLSPLAQTTTSSTSSSKTQSLSPVRRHQPVVTLHKEKPVRPQTRKTLLGSAKAATTASNIVATAPSLGAVVRRKATLPPLKNSTGAEASAWRTSSVGIQTDEAELQQQQQKQPQLQPEGQPYILGGGTDGNKEKPQCVIEHLRDVVEIFERGFVPAASEDMETTRTLIGRLSLAVDAPETPLTRNHDLETGSSHSQGSTNSHRTHLSATGKQARFAEALQKFVAPLAMSSFQLNSQEQPIVSSVSVECAAMFLDISGYSRISKKLEKFGAYALFNRVNSYMANLVRVVESFHGQVIKFCGDAITIIWYGKDVSPERCVRQAAHCAWDLVSNHNKCPIPELPEESFGIHIGVSCGTVKSRVLRSSTVKHMEEYFHLVDGLPIMEATDACNFATRGQVAVADNVVDMLCEGADLRLVGEEEHEGVVLLTSLAPYHECKSCATAVLARESMGSGISRNNLTPRTALLSGTTSGVVGRFNALDVEEDEQRRGINLAKFVHPALLEQHQSGVSQKAMAKMRQLCVMFILKSDTSADIDDWFSEVQDTMDEHRASIIQIIDDDKGLHVVGATNLHLPDKEPAITGIKIAKALQDRCVGCIVGMACGVTFCGVIGGGGSSRFDITGEPCVRACRLMQHAELHPENPIVLDASVVHNANDASLTVPLEHVHLKGNPKPVDIYTVAKVDTLILSSIASGTRYCTKPHEDVVRDLREGVVDKGNTRHAALVRGGPCTGKVVVCVRAVYETGIVPIVFESVENCPPLHVLGTLGGWFNNHRDYDIRQLAGQVLDAKTKGHKLLCLRKGLELIDMTLQKGCKTAFIIRQCQRLDALSLSFLRQSMRAQDEDEGEYGGRWLILVTVVPQRTGHSSGNIMKLLGDSTREVQCGQLSDSETRALAQHVLGWEVDSTLMDTVRRLSNNVAELVVALSQNVREQAKHLSIAKTGVISSNTVAGGLTLGDASWSVRSAATFSHLSQLVEGLHRSTIDILAVVSALSTGFLAIPWNLITSVVTALEPTARNKQVNADLDELVDMAFLQRGECASSGSFAALQFMNPVVQEIVESITLPEVAETIRTLALDRWGKNFQDEHIAGVFGRAVLLRRSDREAEAEDFFQKGLTLLDNPGAKDLEASRSQLWVKAPTFDLTDPEKSDLLEKVYLAFPEFQQSSAPSTSDPSLPAPDTTQTDAGNENSNINITTTTHSVPQEDPPGILSPTAVTSSASFLNAKLLKARVGVDPMPWPLVQLREYVAPMAVGSATMAIASCAAYLRQYAMNTAKGIETPELLREDVMALQDHHFEMIVALDTNTGFRSGIEDEVSVQRSFLQRGGFDVIVKCVEQFLDYVNSTLADRARACTETARSAKAPPPLPKNPHWRGEIRRAKETGLLAAGAVWDECEVTGVRNALLALGTEGFVPLNPDLTLEYQRDCYLRKRTFPCVTMMAYLYGNLCYPSKGSTDGVKRLANGFGNRVENKPTSSPTPEEKDDTPTLYRGASVFNMARPGQAASRLSSMFDEEQEVRGPSLANNAPKPRRLSLNVITKLSMFGKRTLLAMAQRKTNVGLVAGDSEKKQEEGECRSSLGSEKGKKKLVRRSNPTKGSNFQSGESGDSFNGSCTSVERVLEERLAEAEAQGALQGSSFHM